MKKHLSGFYASLSSLRRGQRLLCLFLLLLLLTQLTVLCVYNCTMPEKRVDYDSSADYLRSAEMAEQKRLMPLHWHDTTMLHLDGPVLPAAGLQLLGMELFPAFALCDLLMLALLLWFVWCYTRKGGFALPERLMALCLVVCPWTAEYFPDNDLGYFSCMLTGVGYYLGVFVIFFALLSSETGERKGGLPRRLLRQGLLLFFCFLTAMSRGLYLCLILPVPLAAFYFLQGKSLRSLLFPLSCVFASLLGKLTAMRVLRFASADSGLRLCSASELFENIEGLAEGFLDICGALSSREDILSERGILALGGLALSLLLLWAGLDGAVRAVRTLLRGESTERELPGFLFAWNSAILIFVGRLYMGMEYTQPRYAIVLLLTAILCLPELLRHFHERVKGIAMLGICAALVFHCYAGDRMVFEADSDSAFRRELSDACGSFEGTLIYYYLPDDVAAGCSARAMRALDRGHIYRDLDDGGGKAILSPCWTGEDPANAPSSFRYWGDTDRGSFLSEYDGPIGLLCSDGGFEKLPDALLQNMSCVTTLKEGVQLYRAEKNLLALDYMGQ